jgi:hypothetical protein
MNKISSAAWCDVKKCFLVTEDRRLNRGKRATLSTAVGATLLALSQLSYADIATPYQVLLVQEEASGINFIPGAGPQGNQGSSASYSCNQMTWGAACADFYSFGSYSTREGGTGQNALSGTNATVISNENPNVVDVIQSIAGTPSAGEYTLQVSQLASAMKYSTDSSTGISSTTILNSGRAFNLSLTQGSTITTISVLANATLATVRDAINAETSSTGIVASLKDVEVTTNSVKTTTAVLSVTGATGAGNNFSLVSQDSITPANAVTGLEFSLPAPVIVNGTSYTPLGESSQDAIYTVNGGAPQTSQTNTFSYNGLDLTLQALGSSKLRATEISGAVLNGLLGNAGQAGGAIQLIGENAIKASSISTSGLTSYTLSSTGGAGGIAGQGGAGGQGGSGGSALTTTVPRIMVIVFPPITIPDTDAVAVTCSPLALPV